MQATLRRWFLQVPGLFRSRKTDHGTVKLDRHRIYILPTRQGLLFTVFLLVMLLGSINYALSLGFVLTFLLAGLGLSAMLHTYRNLAGLRITGTGAKPAFAGENAKFLFCIETSTPRPAIGLYLKGHAPLRMDLESKTQIVGVNVPGIRRGWLRPERFILDTVFPLGLFRAWSYLDFGDEALVYPQPLPSPLLPEATGDNPGQHPGMQQGLDDFIGLRSYHPGDSLRHVAWKAASKSDVLLIKQFSMQKSEEYWLDWSRLSDIGTEARLSRLAGLILQAEQSGLRYGLRLPGVEIVPSHGDIHRHSCLKALALFGSDNSKGNAE